MIGPSYQISYPVPLFGLKGMQNGLSRLLMLGIPAASSLWCKRGTEIGVLCCKGGERVSAKEGMIAIPLPLAIQRDDKQIGFAQGAQA